MSKLLFPMASLAIYIVLSVGVAYADVSLVNQYDLNGNLVSGDGKFYEYNDANQLVKVRENDKNGKVVAEYFYDFSGQRVKKVENGVTFYYIGKHFETQVVAGQAKDTAHFFVDNERVAKRDDSGTYFYHPDHLGGTNVVTNTTGNVVARNSYLPFGEMREGGQEKYSYTGKEKDTATDLYYFESRFNSPELRHFTQADIADPDLSDPQDLNRYAYVGNNPLSYVDPDGYKKKKKAKLSKREKWMIAHGVDPDHDKTSLKKAKAQSKAGTKYTTTAKTSPVAQGLAVASTVGGNRAELTSTAISNKGRVLGASIKADDSKYNEVAETAIETASHMGLAGYLWTIMGEAGGALAGAVFDMKYFGYDVPNALGDAVVSWTPVVKDLNNTPKGSLPSTTGGQSIRAMQCNYDEKCLFGD